MTDAYVSTLPGTALGAIGGSLIVVGMSLVVAVALTVVALAIGDLVQRLVERPARGPAIMRLVHVRDRAA
ncbi:MAG TPA: hypothetical protein VKU61_15295 [Candidatus Binatia bacterium]|nr:hypothetical protein [Candidatus Binatia bacterium]